MRNSLVSLFLIVFFFGFLSLRANAQAEFNVNRIQEILSVTVIPKVPKANEKVSIKIESSAYDINSSTLVWFVNDKKVAEGTGYKNFSFTTGDLGTQSHVGVIITPKNGAPFRKDLYFTPVDVALTWEAKTYTPPFYAGKALRTNQALVSVIATPEFITSGGKRLDPDTLIYNWQKNNKAMGSVSGYGKRTLNYFGSVLSPDDTVSVTVTNQDGSVQGEGEVTIPSLEPVVTLYENNPLYGVLYNKAILGSLKMYDREISLSAVPFFFSRKTSAKDILEFNWSVNGVVTGDSTKDVITVRNDSGNSGNSILGIKVLNSGNTFQSAQKRLSLMFGNNQ